MIQIYLFNVSCDQGKVACAEVSWKIAEIDKDFCFSHLSVCFKEKSKVEVTVSPSDLMSNLFRYKPVS